MHRLTLVPLVCLPGTQTYAQPETATRNLVSIGVTEANRRSFASANCFQLVVNLMMHVVDARCMDGADFEEQSDERDETKMSQLFKFSQELAVSVLQRRVPRQGPVTVYSYGLMDVIGEFSFTSQIREFKSGHVLTPAVVAPPPTQLIAQANNLTNSSNLQTVTGRAADAFGFLPGVISFVANVTADSNLDLPGGPLKTKERLWVVGYGYTGVNPLNPSALEDDQASEILVGVNSFVERNQTLEPLRAQGMVELQPAIMASEERRRAELQSLPKEDGTFNYYNFGLRSYQNATSSWSTSGIIPYDDSNWYYLENLKLRQGYSPYLELAQSPPPPPLSPPSPPLPPTPNPPPSPPKAEQDLTAVVIGAAVGVAVLICLLLFLIYRRRRQRKAYVVRPRHRIDPTGPSPTDPLLSPDDEDMEEIMDEDPEAGEGDGLGDTEGFEEVGGDSEGEHEIM